MSPSIAIIGGGPCGLTLARLLECKGIDYVVYERDADENSNATGGSLDLHPETGQRAMREAGLFDEFKRHARYADTLFTLADKFGKTHLQIGEGRDAPEIDRVELRRILLDSIPKDKIKWGHAVTSATLGENGMPVIRFANGTVLSGPKLVIGADGAWSKLRSVITQAKPDYSGRSYIESRIRPDNPIYEAVVRNAGRGLWTSIGSGKLVITQKQGDGSYRIYFGLQVPEDSFRNGAIDLKDVEAMRRLLLSSEFYADWSDGYKDLIRHATDFRGWPLYHLPAEALNWKSVPGMTLAGDAAHVSIPNGEGVNCAMIDSLELVSKIVEHGIQNTDQAVQEYEADMFTRGIDSITQGIMMAEVMFSEDHQPFLRLMNSWLQTG